MKLDKDSLNILLNKPQAEILQLLQKTDTELQANLIQSQIDELEATPTPLHANTKRV